jgi:hypothetical protein
MTSLRSRVTHFVRKMCGIAAAFVVFSYLATTSGSGGVTLTSHCATYATMQIAKRPECSPSLEDFPCTTITKHMTTLTARDPLPIRFLPINTK